MQGMSYIATMPKMSFILKQSNNPNVHTAINFYRHFCSLEIAIKFHFCSDFSYPNKEHKQTRPTAFIKEKIKHTAILREIAVCLLCSPFCENLNFPSLAFNAFS